MKVRIEKKIEDLTLAEANQQALVELLQRRQQQTNQQLSQETLKLFGIRQRIDELRSLIKEDEDKDIDEPAEE